MIYGQSGLDKLGYEKQKMLEYLLRSPAVKKVFREQGRNPNDPFEGTTAEEKFQARNSLKVLRKLKTLMSRYESTKFITQSVNRL